MDGTDTPLALIVMGAPLGYLGGGGRTLIVVYHVSERIQRYAPSKQLTTWRRLYGTRPTHQERPLFPAGVVRYIWWKGCQELLDVSHITLV